MSFQNLSKSGTCFLFMIPLVAGSLFVSGCHSSGGGNSAVAASEKLANQTTTQDGSIPAPEVTPAPSVEPTPTVTPTPSPTSTSPTPQVGESCTGDVNKVCLAIHFVTYQDSKGNPAATTTQAATIIHKMNQLYASCNIGFQIEKYEAVDPTQSGLAYGAQSQNQLNEIRRTYEQPTNQLLAVTTGPWGTAVNGWTNMPGDGVYGAIMEASIVTYGDGIIYAHEFGHYLGLDHVSDNSNLMSPIIYSSSTTLTSNQCAEARATIQSYWSKMVRK